jgi:hypothetical protein
MRFGEQVMLLDERAMGCPESDGSVSFLCSERDLELNLVFSVSNVALLLSSLPLGFALKYFGPKRVAVVGNIMIAIGSFVIAGFFDPKDPVSLVTSSSASNLSRSGIVLMVGMTLISFFGPAIQVSTLAVGVLFPRMQATVVGILSGCMGGSAIVLPAYAAVHSSGPISISGIFWWHGGWSLAMGIAMSVVLPLGQFDDLAKEIAGDTQAVSAVEPAPSKAEPPESALESVSSTVALKPTRSIQAGDAAVEVEMASGSGDAALEVEMASGSGNAAAKAVVGLASGFETGTQLGDGAVAGAAQSTSTLATDSARAVAHARDGGVSGEEAGGGVAEMSTCAMLLQPWFVALVLWLSVQYLRLVFYLGSADLQLRDIANQQGLSPADAERLLPVLGWLAPLGALAAPVAGQVHDRYGSGWALLVTQVLGILHAGMTMVPLLGIQPAAFLAYTWQQEAAFAIVLAAVLDGFGAAGSGIGAGVVFVAGAACSAIISPITAAVLGAGTGFNLVNGILLGLTLVSSALPIAQLCGVKSFLYERR